MSRQACSTRWRRSGLIRPPPRLDVGVEPRDELVVAVSLGDRAAGLGVGGEYFGVEALCGQHR